MFIKKNAAAELADEIAQSMEDNLVSTGIDEAHKPLNKIAIAIEHLNAAAEIFDDVGLRLQAEVATKLLESLAKKKDKKKPVKKIKHKSKKSDTATKGLNSKKMVRNLEEKGWVFNADDGFFADDDLYAEDLAYDFDTSSDSGSHSHREDIEYNHDSECDNDDCELCGDKMYADDDFYADDDMKNMMAMLDDKDMLHKRDQVENVRHNERNFGNQDYEIHDFEDEDTNPYRSGGIADQMDEMGEEYDPRFK